MHKTVSEMLIIVSLTVVCASVEGASLVSHTDTNLVAPADSYSLYKQMMEMKQQLLVNSTTMEKPEPETITRLRNALSLLYDALVDGLFLGFIPHFERQRREAKDERRNYLDLLVIIIGALLGKQNCSKMVACRFVSSRCANIS